MFVRTREITIDEEKCVGCKKCITLCFADVIRFNEVKSKPEAKYLEECEACLICELFCPTQAIRVTPTFPIFVDDPFI